MGAMRKDVLSPYAAVECLSTVGRAARRTRDGAGRAHAFGARMLAWVSACTSAGSHPEQEGAIRKARSVRRRWSRCSAGASVRSQFFASREGMAGAACRADDDAGVERRVCGIGMCEIEARGKSRRGVSLWGCRQRERGWAVGPA